MIEIIYQIKLNTAFTLGATKRHSCLSLIMASSKRPFLIKIAVMLVMASGVTFCTIVSIKEMSLGI